jgi:aminopeptidase N
VLMGKKGFCEGIRNFLQKYQYGNATPAQLWAEMDSVYSAMALRRDAEAEGTNVHFEAPEDFDGEKVVAKMMDRWIHKAGLPVITVKKVEREDNVIELSLEQRRFIADGEWTRVEDAEAWIVPIEIVGGAKSAKALSEPHPSIPIKQVLLVKAKQNFTIRDHTGSLEWIKVRSLLRGCQVHPYCRCS